MLDPTMAQFLSWQRRLNLAGATISSAGGVICAAALFGATTTGFFAGLISAFFLWQLIKFAIFVGLSFYFYSGDFQKVADESGRAYEHFAMIGLKPEPAEVVQLSVKILNQPQEAYGFYQGAPIFEWLLISIDGGTPTKINFHGTIDPSTYSIANQLASGTLLVPPGILYVLDRPQVEEGSK